MNQHDQLSLGWVLPRPFAGSGGLNNIFRMVGALQKWGHNSTIYCCDSERTFGSQAALASFIQTNWGLKGVECLFAGNALKPHDILLATHWSTVSRVKSDPRAVRKAYFVQDFEPLFFAMGDEYIMAENTYSLGLSCITLGHWLENLLRDNYGLDTCGFDFPIDSTIYRRAAGPESRPFDIIYYGQPDKPRRAFHLGCEALRLVKQARPQTNIAMFGSEALAKVQVPFPFRNFGLQTPIELARLYQQSKIALVLSASNPSLVPCEMMACGAAVVDLLRGNNLHDYQPGSIRLAQQNPEALATELLALLEQTEVRQAQITTAESMVTQRSYELSARTVEGALLRLHLTGRVSPAESASLDIRQEFANQQCAVPLEGAAELKSSFVCRMANLTRIDLAILPQSDSVQGELILSLREAGKGEPICRVVRQFSASTGNGFVEFSFPPVPDSAQKTFLISLAFRPKNSAAGSPVILYTDSTDLCPGGALLLAEKSVEGTLRFRTFCRPQLRAPSPLHAAVFDQALRMNGQSGSSKDPAASGLQDICRNIALIERHPAAVSTSEAVRKEKLRSLLKLLNRNGEPSEPATVEALVGGCRKLFREELALAEREEQSNQLLQQAKDEEASGRCKKTEALLKESLRQSTDNEQALLLYGQWLLRQKRTREGFEVLQRLLTLNPRCTAAYNAIGRGMSQKGMVREAHEIFVRAVRCQPQESEGWANLVELHYHSGTRAEGAKILAQWLKLAPADTEAIRWKERYDQPLAPKAASVKGQATDKASKGCISVATLMAEPEEFACPYLRVTSVLKRLEQLGHVRHLRGSRIDDRTLHVNPEQLREADIVLVQRQMAGMLAYPALLQQFKGQMPKIVFDLDDALTVLPKTHRAYQSYARLVPQIEEYLKRADLVTVSTPQLLELYRPFNKNIVVLPNSLDADLWSGPKAGQDPSGRIRILFSGTLDHEQDLRVVEEALLEILAAYPDTVEFLYWGNVTERLRSLPQVRSIHEFTPSYPQYSALLQKLSVSFAIVPLEDTPFNRAKSPIKWLEYSACGIPGIYSDLSPYNQTVEKGMGLVVPNTREAWVAAMKSLVENQALRQELAGQAQQMVMSRHTIAHNAQRWLQTYELLLGHGGSLASKQDNLVSIVIPTFNNLELTRRCLRAVEEHTPSAAYEIVVVDNGSADGTPDFLATEESAGKLKAIKNSTNLGFAVACNQGAAVARGEYILFLNNDTEVQPGWLEALRRTLEHDPLVGAAGSKLLFPDLTIQHAGVAIVNDQRLKDPLLARHAYYQAPQDLPEANQPRVYQAVTAACLIVRRALFNGLGGFDEQFWNGYEDIDLCFRIGQAGKLVVYQPESVVKHHESKGGPERFRKARQNIARLHQKWLGRIYPDFIAGEDGELTRTDTIAIRPYAGPTVQGANASSCIVSIIIPVLNQLADTRQCLESIVAHTRLPHEVIIVDNGSSDSTRSFLRTWQQSHSNCKVIRNSRNLGFAAANNQGFSIAAGEHLVLLNNDTVVTEGWIEGLLRVLRDHPQTGIVGPMSNNVSGPQYAGKVNYQELAELPGFAAEWSQTYKGQSMETPRAVGFCLLARRAVLEQIGGLDESFGSGNFEDDDFCIRARIAGFRIRIAKDVFIHHAGSQTFKTARIDYRQAMLRNWDIFRNKWKLPASTTLESGYPVPNQLPMGTHLRYEIRRLGATHEPDAHGCWEEKTSFGNAAALNRTLPAAATIGDLTSARDLFERKDLKAAWMQAIAAVQQRPFHPEAYLLLAEIALVSGDGQTARLCAQMARELTPDFRAPKQFLQKPLKGKNRPEWLEIPGWLQERISAKSQPSPCISVCIITRNEEAFIAQCLKSVKQIAHQIVVVDTGSTDRTIEIAKDFGAELYQFEWCDDFSAARNVALEHARGDWVLVLDADEELPVDQHARLHADLKNRNAIALRLPLINLGQEAEGCSCVPRLFRNAPGVYYHGRIHEQVFPSLIEAGNEWGLGTGIGTAQLLHHGYSKKQVRDRNKVERNLALLRLAVAESNDDPNLVMNFGLELIRSGDFSGGLTQYRRAFELMSERTGQETAPELREALLTQFTSHLYQAQAFDEVVEVLTSPLGRRAGLTASLHFALGLACFALNRFEEAAEQMRQCLAKRQQRELTPINTDILTAAPQHCLAMSLAKAGDLIGAEKAFQAGLTEKGREDELKLDYARFLKDNGRPVDALHQLHEVVSAKADCASAWRLGAEISLSQTEFLEFACDWTAEAVRHIPDNHELAAQRAEALLLSRQIAPALTAWEALWNREHQPRFQAAIILCQVLGEATPTSPEVCEAELGAVSRAFLAWYQRCLAMRAQPIVERVNERLETLSTMLPAASNMIEAALTEAAADSKATAEPCLA